MSVETQCHQNHGNNENFSLSNHKDEIGSAALNLSQIHRKNGRKRSTPQKSVNPSEDYDEDESSGDETFPNGHSPELPISESALEGTTEKTKSILEHYRSFIQRNTGIGEEMNSLGLKKPKLMKTSSLNEETNNENSWDSQPKLPNEDEPLIFEPMINGPVNGPHGLIPERTMRQNNWAIKVWRDWAISRNRKPETKIEMFPEAPVDIRVADVEVMSYWLPKFIKEVRRKDKKPYPADTLMQIASGLQRYLRQVSCRSEINFFDKYSNTFAEFRDALKRRSGELSQEAQTNKTGKKIQVDNLTDDELWQSGYLDYATAKGIFHVMFYYNSVEFEITSMEEHHDLKVEQFHVALDANKNKEYVQFKRSDQRFYNMSTKQIMRHYAVQDDPRCLVKLYKTYLDLVPSTGPFYRRPLQTPENSSPRFSFNPVGINKLRETHKQLFSSDRPASMRQSGKTTTIRHTSQQSNNEQIHELPSRSPTSSLNQPISRPSQIVYDALTQKLKDNGHLPTNDAVDLTVKAAEAVESDDEPTAAAPLTIQKVMESIRQKWQNVQQTRYRSDFANESDSDEVLTLRVPQCVKCVVIEREGKKQKFELN